MKLAVPRLTAEVFREAPTFVVDNVWRLSQGEEEEEGEEAVAARVGERLRLFQPDVGKGRKVVMAQYWFDKIDRHRRRALQH